MENTGLSQMNWYTSKVMDFTAACLFRRMFSIITGPTPGIFRSKWPASFAQKH